MRWWPIICVAVLTLLVGAGSVRAQSLVGVYDLTATVLGPTSVRLDWEHSEGDDPEDACYVNIRVAGEMTWTNDGLPLGPGDHPGAVAPGVGTLTITGLTTDVEYEFFVASATGFSYGTPTEVVSVTPHELDPEPVFDELYFLKVIAIAVSWGTAVLIWQSFRLAYMSGSWL